MASAMEDFYRASVEEQIRRLKTLAVEALKHWNIGDASRSC